MFLLNFSKPKVYIKFKDLSILFLFFLGFYQVDKILQAKAFWPGFGVQAEGSEEFVQSFLRHHTLKAVPEYFSALIKGRPDYSEKQPLVFKGKWQLRP